MTVLRELKSWKKPRPRLGIVRMDRLDAEEQENVRVALRALRVRYGALPIVAKAMGIPAKTLQRIYAGKRRVQPGAAIAVARLAKVPVDDVLTGAFPTAGSCPMCGRCGTG